VTAALFAERRASRPDTHLSCQEASAQTAAARRRMCGPKSGRDSQVGRARSCASLIKLRVATKFAAAAAGRYNELITAAICNRPSDRPSVRPPASALATRLASLASSHRREICVAESPARFVPAVVRDDRKRRSNRQSERRDAI